MATARFDNVATISGTSPEGTGTTSENISVTIGFERCSASNPNPPFQGSGAIEIFAKISWFSPQGTPTTVQGFTDGDISILTENDPAIVEQARLGHVANAGVTQGHLTGGAGGVYYVPLTLNPNSAGEIYVTVLSLSAFTIPTIGDDSSPIFGPFQPTTSSFTYSTIAAIGPAQSKPEVDIITPSDPIFNQANATINLLWDSEIRSDANIESKIGPMNSHIIRITGGTYVPMSFNHSANTRRMSFQVMFNANTSGTSTIRVKANSFTDTNEDTGPPSDTSESFLFDTGLSIQGDDTPEDTGATGDTDIIYDSGSISFTDTSNPLLTKVIRDDDGNITRTLPGAFKGVSDLKRIGNNLYGVVQAEGVTTSGILDQGEPARAALFRITIGDPGSLNATLKKYDNITQAARSITELGDRIYAFEGSYPGDGLGNLISFGKTGSATTSHGIPWRSRLFNPNAEDREDNITYSQHVRMSSPMAIVNDNLYLNPGYGAIRSIKSTDWESSENPEGLDAQETRIDNWTLLKYGSSLDFRPAEIQTNELTGYEVIRQLAELCFCYIGFDGNKFIFRPRFQPTAKTTQDITMADDTFSALVVKDRNMDFPASGLLRITGQSGNKEIFEYETRSGNSFTVSRSKYGTVADDHCPDSSVEYVSHVIDMEQSSYQVRPINSLNMRQDLQQLYNIIKISYGDQFLDQEEVFKDDEPGGSIEINKPRELELSVGLNHHDTEWVQWLANQYLNFYKDVRYLLEVQLQPSFFIKTGDFILLRESRNSLINNQVFQVLRTTHTIKPYVTSLQLRLIP